VAYVGNHGVRTPTNVNLNVSYTLNSGNAGLVFAPRTQSYVERWWLLLELQLAAGEFDRRFYKASA